MTVFPLRFPVILCSLIILCTSIQAQDLLPPKCTKLPQTLKEVSGMIHLANGDVWMLNDSRNPSILFRYNPVKGEVVETRTLPVPNRDWEDLTTDQQGNLFIGDFGNNGNARKDLRIYRYHIQTGALDTISFYYPDQSAFPPKSQADWNFNCEAMVFLDDSLHLFSKNVFKGNCVTKQYVLPAQPGNYTAELRDSLVLKNSVVTGAALSPDGKTLAFSSYMIKRFMGIPFTRLTAHFFSGFQGSQFLRGTHQKQKLPKFLNFRQYEAITWWNDGVWLVANEQNPLSKQAVRRLHSR